MLKLRRGVVRAAGEPRDGMQALEVEIGGHVRAAVADVALIGRCERGDELVLNVEAVDLALGSGGLDLVHVNLTRGLAGEGAPGAHVMKLNYTSLQHAVQPVERAELGQPLASPVAVIALHGHLAPVAWALAQASPGARIGFVQTAGGALPGRLSRVVAELRSRELLTGHITAGPAYGGEGEAISTAGAIDHGLAELGWQAAICGPGPGILGSASALGHGGMAALDSAHSALALGALVVIVPRMSSSDPRPRHRGLSHHTETVLRLLLREVVVALPEDAPAASDVLARHDVRRTPADLDGYAASGLPTHTMGRSLDEDRLFFAAGLAGGRVLGGMLR
jgi:Protein of unknown function (DUF3866)